MTLFAGLGIYLFGLTMPCWKMRLHWYVVTGVLLLGPCLAFGEEPIPEDRIVSLKKGALAPFDGQLFDNPTALRWGVYLQQMQARHEVELDTQKKHCEEELEFKRTELWLERDKSKKIADDLAERLRKTEALKLQAEHERDNPPWYKTPVFGFVLGAVAVGTFGVLAVQTF
jgi:uncharacterized coiled-coil protein SlyX